MFLATVQDREFLLNNGRSVFNSLLFEFVKIELGEMGFLIVIETVDLLMPFSLTVFNKFLPELFDSPVIY